jgi:hypothetical protein
MGHIEKLDYGDSVKLVSILAGVDTENAIDMLAGASIIYQ